MADYEAYVVLNKRRQHVATVTFKFTESQVTATVITPWSATESLARIAKVKGWVIDQNRLIDPKTGKAVAYVSKVQEQTGKAGGYGYDKRAAALAGLYIDGHEMGDHSSSLGAPKKPRGFDLYPADYIPPKGYRLANYQSATEFKPGGYLSCFREQGMKYLTALGYDVIQAL